MTYYFDLTEGYLGFQTTTYGISQHCPKIVQFFFPKEELNFVDFVLFCIIFLLKVFTFLLGNW